MDNLTHNLNEMIRNQRLAEGSRDSGQQASYHAEAMRCRLMAQKLEKQIRLTRQSISGWLNLN